MTIFRSDKVDPGKLSYQFVSATEPETFGVEVALDGNVLIDVEMALDGRTNVMFDQDGGSTEFELTDLRQVLDRCEQELNAWRLRHLEVGEAEDMRE